MKIVGHRGARGLAPENTLASLTKALEFGVDELEFDLRVTKDKVVILHHDTKLSTPAGDEYTIKDHKFEELKKYKNDLTRLDEVIDQFLDKCVLHIEVKKNEPIEPIVKLLKGLTTTDKLLLASKSQKTLVKLHSQLPEIENVVIEPWSGVRAHYRVRQISANRVSMNQLTLWSLYISTITKRGYKIYAYPLNDPKKAKAWEKYGLYGVITDYPDRFKAKATRL
jgi:glycerophosphoryl diester phosphodiesterase